MSMLGYWRNNAADAETVRPGRWIRTGDFGRLEHGILFIASRKRDLIIRGGENIYPFEIEHRLDEHPDIVEATVFGIDDPVHGQEVKAVVVVRPGTALTADEVRAFCAESLASYKVPATVELPHRPAPADRDGQGDEAGRRRRRREHVRRGVSPIQKAGDPDGLAVRPRAHARPSARRPSGT